MTVQVFFFFFQIIYFYLPLFSCCNYNNEKALDFFFKKKNYKLVHINTVKKKKRDNSERGTQTELVFQYCQMMIMKCRIGMDKTVAFVYRSRHWRTPPPFWTVLTLFC